MRDFWTIIGGVAVGILAAISVFTTEAGCKPQSTEHGEDELEESEDMVEEETVDDGRLIVRSS